MCGIVGIVSPGDPRPIDRGLLTRMNDAHSLRGPDGAGIHIEPGVGFGHRRLSIVDLEGGKQPLCNEDGTVWVTYNGEIYNHLEIAKELRARGHQFATRCDTEVVVHAWEEWGVECVKRFRGMFAFAVWDRNKQTLFMARDRLGIKPLYYSRLPDGQWLFGSELKSLLQHPGLDRRSDPMAVEEYFSFGYIPEPRTMLEGVYKLPPGHWLKIEAGGARTAPVEYWDIHFQPDHSANESASAVELIDRLREAVSLRLMADVPLGAFLSGGVDSSAVVSMMAGLSDDPVRTQSISFGDPKFNESQYAQQVADRYHTAHRVEQVESHDFSLVDTLAHLYDEPFADSSALPTYRVCELASRDVKVALSGDGGDENLAGYSRYRWHDSEMRYRKLIPQFLRGPLLGSAARLYPAMPPGAPRFLRLKPMLQALARDPVAAYSENISVLGSAARRRLFSGDFSKKLQGYEAAEVLRRHAKKMGKDESVSLLQYLDMKTYLPGDILTKVDRVSMANGLEVRVPFLDHEFMEWMAKLPLNFKYQNKQGKYLLKKSLEPYLPNEVLYRSKQGFAVPLADWFRGPLRSRMNDSLLSPALADTGYFNSGEIRKLIDDHQSKRANNSSALWALLMFSLSHASLFESGTEVSNSEMAAAAGAV